MTSTPGVMRIGEVHAQLRAEFPELELSKIRYYEDMGLVKPARSRKGYRLYSERDLACLREAIRLAQEEFVPLRVVRLRLIEQGLLDERAPTATAKAAARESSATAVRVVAPVPSRPPLNVVPDPVSDAEVEPVAVDSATLSSSAALVATGLSAAQFNELQALGLLSPETVDGETVYRADDVRVAALARPLLARGIDARRLLSLRRIAERQVGVIEEITDPVRRGANGIPAEQASRVVAEVTGEINALTRAMLGRLLRP